MSRSSKNEDLSKSLTDVRAARVQGWDPLGSRMNHLFQEEEEMEAGVYAVGALVLLGITFSFMFQKFHSGRK